MTRLDDILAGNPEEAQKKDRALFSALYVTEDALMKARTYAQLARDRSGNYIECYGYLLGDLDRRKRIANDAYLAPEQDNNSTHTEISGETVLKAAKEIREKFGKRVIGWWHSHCDFETFHSGTDEANHHLIAYQIAPGNYLNRYEEFEFLSGELKKVKSENGISIGPRNNMSRRLELKLSGTEAENVLKGVKFDKVSLRVPIRTGYAYSMVVNAVGDRPYTEIATLEYAPLTMKEQYSHFKVPLKVIDGVKLNFTEKELKEEIKKKIILPPPIRYSRKKRIGFIEGGKYIKSPAWNIKSDYTTEEKPKDLPNNSPVVENEIVIVSPDAINPANTPTNHEYLVDF